MHSSHIQTLLPFSVTLPIVAASATSFSTFLFLLSALALSLTASRDLCVGFELPDFFLFFLSLLNFVLAFNSETFSIPQWYRWPRRNTTSWDNRIVGAYYFLVIKFWSLVERYYERKIARKKERIEN